MLKLQIQNLGVAPIAFKDPEGYTGFVAEVAANTTSTFDISADLLDRIYAQLKALETPMLAPDGTTILAGIRWNILAASTTDPRVTPEGSSGLPTVTGVALTAVDNSSGNTPVTLRGAALLSGQTKASAFIGTAAIGFRATAVVPGTAGNDITVAVADAPTGEGKVLTVGVVGSAITITPATGGSTAAAIIAAVNADATAKALVLLSDGAGTFTTAVAATKLSGGVGPGVSVSVDGTACTILATTDTTVIFTIPAGIGAAGDVVALDYRNGTHVSRLCLPVIA